MIKIAARDTDYTLVRVFNYTVISAINISVKVISNFISAVLRHDMIILLTLKASHNVIFLRVNINIIILII